jgi:SPP1 family predicted phage head-tail adaptor
MRAGTMNRRVVVQRATETQGTTGELATTWVDVATVWASITPMKGDELYRAQQVNARLSHRVSMRFRDGVTPKMRLSYGARLLQIEECINIREEGVELQLLCSEWVEV